MAEQENLIPLAGSLLIAHPGMGDPNFKKTVILMASHSAESGAIGIIINRPTELTLGEVDNETANTPLANVTIYQGGPIASKQLILTAWQWNANIHMFKLHFGLTKEMALQVHTSSDVQLKGFLGYAGWDKGQLENELQQKAWLVCPLDKLQTQFAFEKRLWFKLLCKINPTLLLLADVPVNPLWN